MLSIHTNGTETPADILYYDVSVLRTQLEHFLAAPEIPFNEISAHTVEEVKKTDRGAETQDTSLKGISSELLLKPTIAHVFSPSI